ncbi:MAG: hypothetical protein M3Q61_01680, partial [Chloroflexota bacterium]|nr:hypothetical protein [Chloroflexota bacterium]
MELALPAAIFVGILLIFWGTSTLMGATDGVEERMARYAGGAEAQRKERATEKKKKDKKGSRQDIDPFATLSSDVEDKRRVV